MTAPVFSRVRSLTRISSERFGLVGLVLVGVALLMVGARLVSGPLAVLVLALAALVVVGWVSLAVVGNPETKRALAPYGLLKPGSMWLALFYLAPLWTLLKSSLSSKESRSLGNSPITARPSAISVRSSLVRSYTPESPQPSRS